MDKVTRQCPQTTTFLKRKENWSGIEPVSFCYQLNALLLGQTGLHRIMKTQELVYDRPNLIRSQVGSVSAFGCMLQFCIFFFSPSNLCVYSVQCRQNIKLNNANVQSSIIVSSMKEHYNYVCVQFSVGLCQLIHIILCAYVCSCMCMCSPRGAYLSHRQYVQVGSWGQLCACV